MLRNSLFLLLILLSGCSLGQRLLTVEVRVDDEVRFQGIRGVVDSTPVPEMWNVVPDVPLSAAAEAPDGSNCELNGNISIHILHGSRELTRADLKSVSLSRQDKNGRWFLKDTASSAANETE